MDLILEINGKAIKVAIRGEGAFETNDSPAIHFDIVLVVLDLCAVSESVPPPIVGGEIQSVHVLVVFSEDDLGEFFAFRDVDFIWDSFVSVSPEFRAAFAPFIVELDRIDPIAHPPGDSDQFPNTLIFPFEGNAL